MKWEPDQLREWSCHPKLLFDAAILGRHRLFNEHLDRESLGELVQKLRRKHPGFSSDDYVSLLVFFEDLWACAASIVTEFRFVQEKKGVIWPYFTPQDAHNFLRQLDQHAPGFASDVKFRMIDDALHYLLVR